MRTIPCLLVLATMLGGFPFPVSGDSFNRTTFILAEFYDLEGRTGFNTRLKPSSEDATYVFVHGGGLPYFQPDVGFAETLPIAAGTPLSFKTVAPEIPGVGTCVTGYLGAESFVNGTTVTWFVPVKASEVSLRPFGEDVSDSLSETTDDFVRIDFLMSVTSNRTTPSLQSGITWIPNLSERSVTITVEYLNGNRLADRGMDTHVFPSATTDGPFPDFFLNWGDHLRNDQPPYDPSHARFGFDAPIGPMRVHFKMDGYTTETLNIDAENFYYYKYYGFVTPNYDGTEPPGPGPNELSKPNFPDEPSLGLIRKSIADVVTCGCIPTSEIEPYIEQNDDTIRDAADIVRAMVQGAESP
ncbi:MAG: hypothetical protein RLY93_15050 [Sumerlaeia bacterium]